MPASLKCAARSSGVLAEITFACNDGLSANAFAAARNVALISSPHDFRLLDLEPDPRYLKFAQRTMDVDPKSGASRTELPVRKEIAPEFHYAR